MPVDWLDSYADRVDRVQSSIIREILKMMAVPGVISFAGGMPAPELFPKKRMAEATARLLASDVGTAALQYAVTDGYAPLRKMILQRMHQRGLTASLDNIFITSGAQQGLDIVGKLLINSGDRVLVEDPTYLGALQAWNIYGATYETVDTDEQGIIPDALERALQSGPASLLYLVPTFQNPTGITLSAERRQRVVELAAEYGVPIVEDDPYGELRFEGEDIDPLVAYDGQTNGVYTDNTLTGGNVIYLGTFSKTLCPGLRVGWVIAPESTTKKLVQIKQSIDLHTSSFGQMVAYETAKDGFLDQHVITLADAYRERRDLMLALMEEKFPAGTSWIVPMGGLFIWASLPPAVNARKVLKEAVAQKVAFVPGEPFYPNGGGKNKLRMNFSNASAAEIHEGIDRLAAVFNKVLNPEFAAD
jgi:2-aminoadipate transaminase